MSLGDNQLYNVWHRGTAYRACLYNVVAYGERSVFRS